jgi:hypothetical protein
MYLVFDNVLLAQVFARTHDRVIYVEIQGYEGVFQVYPGGRTIKWPATERYVRRLTPAKEFDPPPSKE